MVLKNKMFGVALSVAITAGASLAHATDTRDVVRSDSSHVVVNTFNNCVRTDWNANYDACGATIAANTHISRSSESLTLEDRTIYFEFDKSRLTPEAKKRLNTLAANLKSDTQILDAKIVGYADRIGSEEYNDKLSQRRANSVKDYLEQQGFINSRVTETRWFGEKVPVTQCPHMERKQLIACLSKDRRVEVEIEYKPTR